MFLWQQEGYEKQNISTRKTNRPRKKRIASHFTDIPSLFQYTASVASFTPYNSCSVMCSWIWEPCRVAEVSRPWAHYKGTWKWNNTAAAHSINLPSPFICCKLVLTGNSRQRSMGCFRPDFFRSDCLDVVWQWQWSWIGWALPQDGCDDLLVLWLSQGFSLFLIEPDFHWHHCQTSTMSSQ